MQQGDTFILYWSFYIKTNFDKIFNKSLLFYITEQIKVAHEWAAIIMGYFMNSSP